HTDSDGTDNDNQKLSEARAHTVADALKPLLGSDYTYKTEGKGEKEPIADNDTDQGRALNRRVTVTLPE
ncbi:MAG: OmpA family protein, partial [Propioniciclava sp.]